MMWRYNWLIKRGWIPFIADAHQISDYGIYYTNVLMAKGLKRKTIRLNGTWDLQALNSTKESK